MPQSIQDILGKVKAPVRSTWVCLDGELWSRHDELAHDIDQIRAASGVAKMGDSTEVAEKSAELRQVEQAMREAEVEFKFRGISSYRRNEIIAAHPSKDPRLEWDTTAGAHELLAAASVDPVMTEDEARQLIGSVNHGVTAKLFNCAWGASEGSADVPFFARAFASTGDSGSK